MIKRMKHYRITIILALIFMPLCSMACSCITLDANTFFSKARYVFEGHITKSETLEISGNVGEWTGSKNEEFVSAKFKLLQSWKGNPSELSGVISHSHSSACGVHLAAGQNYIFFVFETWNKKGLLSNGQYGVVNLCASLTHFNEKQYESTLEWLNHNRE